MADMEQIRWFHKKDENKCAESGIERHDWDNTVTLTSETLPPQQDVVPCKEARRNTE